MVNKILLHIYRTNIINKKYTLLHFGTSTHGQTTSDWGSFSLVLQRAFRHVYARLISPTLLLWMIILSGTWGIQEDFVQMCGCWMENRQVLQAGKYIAVTLTSWKHWIFFKPLWHNHFHGNIKMFSHSLIESLTIFHFGQWKLMSCLWVHSCIWKQEYN